MSAFDLFRYSTPDVVCPFKDLTESLKVENTTPYCNFLGKGIILLEISLLYCETVINNHTCLFLICYRVHDIVCFHAAGKNYIYRCIYLSVNT